MTVLSPLQIEVLREAMTARCRHGLYTMDRHYEMTTFKSLRRRKLLGYYVLPQKWLATRYKITPAGRSALATVRA